MVKLPSASRLSLAMKCAGSFMLPQVKSDPGEAAKRGTAKHALVENYLNSERTIPEGLGDEERALLRRIGDLLGSPAKVFERPELAVAVYPDDHHAELYTVQRGAATSGGRDGSAPRDLYVGSLGGLAGEVERRNQLRLLGSGGGLDLPSEDVAEADYRLLYGSNGQPDEESGCGSRETTGPDRHRSFLAIADCIRSHGEESYEVWDWKTGSSYVPDPQWNWQLILPSVGLWLCSGRNSSFKCSASIVYLDKPDDRPSQFVYDHEFCERAIFYLKRLYSTAKNKDAATVDLYEGKHCVFCPARDRCPAKIGALAAAFFASRSDEVLEDSTMIKALIAVTETAAMRKKAGESILERHGGVFNLGDGREAVLDKSGKRTKIYTRKATSGKEERSNAEEDGKPGAEGEGVGSDSEGGA